MVLRLFKIYSQESAAFPMSALSLFSKERGNRTAAFLCYFLYKRKKPQEILRLEGSFLFYIQKKDIFRYPFLYGDGGI